MSAAVAVTGIGIVSPIGVGPRRFWDALCNGRSGITAAALGDGGVLPTVAAQVRDFAARELITSSHYRRMDALSRMAVAACRMALDDARALPGLAPERLAIAYGSAYGNVAESVQYLDKLFGRGPAAASPLLFPNLVLNAPASYAAMELDAQGVNLTLSQGEVSGEAAIAAGADLIRAGRADVVLAGGADELAAIIVTATRQARALAGQRGGREWASPYDRGRSGLVLGEGAAMLALEPLERARRRGAPIYAFLAGTASAALPAPPYDWPAADDARGVATVPGDGAVQLVCAGGNSSRRLDACELALLDAHPATRDASLTSIKWAIGEWGAAGALTAATACLAVRHQLVPPLPHLEAPEATCALRLAGRHTAPRPIARALVHGIARGGATMGLLFTADVPD